jgi:hypothetical protein
MRMDAVKNDFVLKLRYKAMEILSSNYEYVIGYHGCRISDKRSYQNKGILLSNPGELIKKARTLFENFSEFEDAIKEISNEYFQHNESRIGLLISGNYAKNTKNPYSSGSELILSIALRLGKEAIKVFFKTGTPSLIKCQVPVESLDLHCTFPMLASYSSTALSSLIFSRLFPNDELKLEGGYLLKKPIPKENILEFIDMTNYTDERKHLE